jgi:hypothetical protein
MTTTTVPIAIVCPEWSEVDPEEHAANLWEMGGNVIHRSGGVWVDDPTGYCEALEAPRMHERIVVEVTAMTRPDRRATTSPVVYIDDKEHSLEQAVLLSDVLASMVERYRAG